MKNNKKKNDTFTTLSQQILSGRLLLVVIGEQKNNFSDGFKLELVTIFHINFIMKVLRKIL